MQRLSVCAEGMLLLFSFMVKYDTVLVIRRRKKILKEIIFFIWNRTHIEMTNKRIDENI